MNDLSNPDKRGGGEIKLIWKFGDSASDKRVRRRAGTGLWYSCEALAFYLNAGVPPEFLSFFEQAMEVQVDRRLLTRPGVEDRDGFESRVLLQWESLRYLNDQLAPFKFHMEVVHSDDGSYRDEIVPEFDPPVEMNPIRVSRLFSLTLELLSANRLDRVRRCACCRQWIAAIRDNQRFCSTLCRQRDFESRPENREQRNATRRKSYRNQVFRAQKGLEIVKKKTRGAKS